MGYLLFQITLIIYLLATGGYAVFFTSQRKEIRTVARRILVAAGIVHTLYLIVRYIEAGHTPLTSHHETVSFFAWSMTWAYLSFHWRFDVKNFGSFVSPLVSILMIVAAVSSRQVIPLSPLFNSIWLPIHASVAIMAYSFLALAFCGGIMYLLQERELKKKRFGYFFNRLPSLEALDHLNRHCLAVGFSLMTLGIFTGIIWARQALGTYWRWDPKETWALITWFMYAFLIHQRFVAGWRGRRAAVMIIICFGAVIFTLWGVNFLFSGVHSYVG
jgi:cytochrome c-type biogenesis protein CcsB